MVMNDGREEQVNEHTKQLGEIAHVGWSGMVIFCDFLLVCPLDFDHSTTGQLNVAQASSGIKGVFLTLLTWAQ